MISVKYGHENLWAGAILEGQTTSSIKEILEREGAGRKLVHKHYEMGKAEFKFEPEAIPQKTFDALVPILMNLAGQKGAIEGVVINDNAI